MSQPAPPKTEPGFEELLARAEEIKRYLDALANTLNTYLTQYRELQIASETLKNIPSGGGETLVVVDRLSTALVPTRIAEDWDSRVLVNLGLGYYLKTSRDKALEIISRRISELERVVNELRARYEQLSREYNELREKISAQLATQESSQLTM